MLCFTLTCQRGLPALAPASQRAILSAFFFLFCLFIVSVLLQSRPCSKSSKGWAATQAGFFWLKWYILLQIGEAKIVSFTKLQFIRYNYNPQMCKSMLCLSVSRPLSWITTLRSATLSRTPRTHSSTWSSRCSWAKYLVSVSLCANLYHSCFDHNSPIEPGPCFNFISWPQLHCYISV